MFLLDLFAKWIFDILAFAGYICGNDAFPPALCAEDEKKYIELLKDGDMTARQILIEHNLRLVAHIAKKYGDESNLEDFISIGTVGLIKGIDTYDFSKKTRLCPYVSRCIENEILMTLRSGKKRRADVSIDDTIGVDKEGNSLTLSDILPADNADIADELWTKTEIVKLRKAMKKVLTENEMYIICKRYGLGGEKALTQREIASKLGISRSYVSRIEKKCLKKLNAEMEQNRGY